MTTIDEMDEFVNWNNAAAAVGSPFTRDPALNLNTFAAEPDMGNMESMEGMGLALERQAEDDFGFSALQHFGDDTSLPLPTDSFGSPFDSSMVTASSMLFWEDPVSPCLHCSLSNYACKKIREGRHQGYCTSCVALRVECSFGGVGLLDTANSESTTFPNNSWSSVPDLTAFAYPELSVHEPVPRVVTPAALESSSLANNSESDTGIAAPNAVPPPKIGARFSRDSVRILKNWLTTHNRHPYPSDKEKEILQCQTGLNKTQIINWLANARRRGKVHPPRPTSPVVGNWNGAVDIPQRRGTPALEAMNPLQRWEHSPPEHEPASVTAIARAVTASTGASSGLESPFSFNYTDDSSGRSLCNQSSASSLGTSQSSGGSLQSAYSHGSRNSWGSLGSAPFNHNHGRRRRRRRAATKQNADGTTSLSVTLKTFQCTFCTETFKTKHDWQRHEKSLHLSLERWVCTPEGPKVMQSETGRLCCVFCGLAEPDDEHVESHNHSACQERTLAERTFYRKDHLNQHLRLVHNVKFMDSSMRLWKVATPEIRSRCGFCGIVMDTWTIRMDHLAEHFKTGYSMADWKGDWGFDVPVLDMVENSIPPYLIHHERTSPLPFVADQSPPDSPRNAYELIKLEMAYFGANHVELQGKDPTDEEMMVEGCRIIFASELLSLRGIATQVSWLRDLIMGSEDLAKKARFGRLRGATESRLTTLKINGKDNLFEACPMEFQLQEFVRAKRLLGLTAMDDELQAEACRIVGRVEEISTHPSEAVANWLLRLIRSSTEWLAPFRRRAHLPRSEDVQDLIIRSRDPNTIDSTIHSYSRLERELADFLKVQRALGTEPSDEDLQRQARAVIYEFDDGWNQTVADNAAWLEAFRERHPRDSPPARSGDLEGFAEHQSPWAKISVPPIVATSVEPATNPPQSLAYFLDASRPQRLTNHFFNDTNCYQRLQKELGRWAASTMSRNNPNQHVPTDAELQHQARWILYDDDDPWNQTAADNAEWLLSFKRDTGILKEGKSGLPKMNTWTMQPGGSRLSLSRVAPEAHIDSNGGLVATQEAAVTTTSAGQNAAHDQLEGPKVQYPRTGTVFCSRELEQGLTEMVEKHALAQGCLPTDAAIQARAREIVKSTHTSADDSVLLQKFKDWTCEKIPNVAAAPATNGMASDSAMPMDTSLHISDEELDNILEDMNFEFDAQGWGGGGEMEEGEDAGGVSLGSSFRG